MRLTILAGCVFAFVVGCGRPQSTEPTPPSSSEPIAVQPSEPTPTEPPTEVAKPPEPKVEEPVRPKHDPKALAAIHAAVSEFGGNAFHDYTLEMSYVCMGKTGSAADLAALPVVPFVFTLDLTNSPIGDEGIPHMLRQPNLTSVYAATSKITPAGLKQLKSVPPGSGLVFTPPMKDTDAVLRNAAEAGVLRLLPGSRGYSPGLSGTLAATDEDLNALSLWRTNVTGVGLKILTKYKKIAKLDLTETRLTDADVELFKQFPALVHLKLDKIPITDASIPALLKLEALKELSIKGTKITADGARKLRAKAGLTLVSDWER